METLKMMGCDKREVLHESEKTFVCRAKNREGKLFLIKAFKEDQPANHQLTRFEYEYALLKEQSIPGFIQMVDLIKNYKGHFMIMEDQGGVSLMEAPIFKSIQQGEKSFEVEVLKQILQAFIEMAKIVEGIHERHLTHKAIKPSVFIILPDSNHISMIDIGTAVNLEQAQTEENQERYSWNTLLYISPEQTGRVSRQVDYRTDLYSLGVVYYELITGQTPFRAERLIELVHCHIAEKPQPPNKLNPNIPEMVSNIIIKLLEKAPEQRYQSVVGLIHDLGGCLEQLSISDNISPFVLGEKESKLSFQKLKKLYGRNAEKEKIRNLYRQVENGAVRMLLIGGHSGVGKTSIIQEICRPISEIGGYFTTGKAEQFHKSVPYHIFILAVQDLVETLLQEPDHRLEQWKEILLKELDDNGQLILDLVPDFVTIIGPQPPISELNIAENKYRFFTTFGNFIKAFAQKGHPLTISLDDLQWCDRPSMDLIKYLISREDLECLMLIGCYRDNESLEGHPLRGLLHELNKSEKVVELGVHPLSEEHITEMLTDALQLQAEVVQPLAEIINKKSHGNPFFIQKIMALLNEGNYIRYDRSLQSWLWDIKKVESIAISENIVEVLINQLQKLPQDTLEILEKAALIGSSFDLKLLSDVSNMTALEVLDRMRYAIDAEIIVATDNVDMTSNMQHAQIHDFEFRFAHDRIQQACVEMMDEGQRRKNRLKVGQAMKRNTPKDKWQECAIDIVAHLNEGITSIETEEECWEYAQLNLWACQRAKASSAFYSALRYIENGIGVLTENAWAEDYELTASMYKMYVECAYLNNDYELAEKQVQNLLFHTKNIMEQAEIRMMQSTIFNYQGQLDKAIECATLGLEVLKLRVIQNPSKAFVLKEMMSVKARLIGKRKESLLNLPKMQNEKFKLALNLWNEINRAAYLYGNNNLFLLSILMQMKLTLRYGSTREMGETFISYAMILAVLGDLKGTYEFCELARLSCEKEKSFECMPTILFSSGFFGHAWNRPWTDIVEWFEQAMEKAIRYGDHHTIALAGAFMYACKPDENIKLLAEKATKQFPLVKQTDNRSAFNFAFLMTNRYLNYAGLTDGQFSLSVSLETYRENGGLGVVFSEEECLEALRKGNFLSGFGVYYKEKMFIHYLYDDYFGAMLYLKESDKYLEQHLGTPYIVECRVCSFLVISANLPSMGRQEVKKARQRLNKEYGHVKKWAKHCPENFSHLQYMMEAELARLDDKPFKAVELFEEAVQAARQNGFMRDEALSNELAGKMFIALGKEKQARFYMLEAYNSYRIWGADEKLRYMSNKYSHLLRTLESINKQQEKQDTTEELDMMSLVAASKAVTKEEQLPNLLTQIIKTVMETSGAQRASILLKTESGWNVEAERHMEGPEMDVLQSIPLEEYSNRLPNAIINFCIRIKESIVLGDASNIGRYTNEPYIQKNKIKSLLCMPIINQGSIEGLVYIENNLSSDVFTKERVDILQLLAAQFSISIKNAQLFRNLLVKTEEVHQATEEVLRSDIAFLQAQIKPHFLYNAINTISAYSLDDSQGARDLLANLSQYLRGSFDFKNRDKLVTLRKEMELVEAYLAIEKARFGDRLKVVYNMDEKAECLLPPLVIQPIVENAVHHGLSSRKKGGTILITILSEEDIVRISVEDDGVGMDDVTYETLFEDSGQKRSGVGLKNIQLRLQQFYGHGLEIERLTVGGTKVSIKIKK